MMAKAKGPSHSRAILFEKAQWAWGDLFGAPRWRSLTTCLMGPDSWAEGAAAAFSVPLPLPSVGDMGQWLGMLGEQGACVCPA